MNIPLTVSTFGLGISLPMILFAQEPLPWVGCAAFAAMMVRLHWR